MPELAEVEYYRRQWDPGIGRKIEQVTLHGEKRIFRGGKPGLIAQTLAGAKLLSSETRGKQMLFRFSRGDWLALHLGMTGELRVEPPDFAPGKHDHLVLFQKARALVFADPRMFGRVQFHHGQDAPKWWTDLPPEVGSAEFTVKLLSAALARRKGAPIKAVLLDQALFPGIGNWMADEILWQARLDPRTPAARFDPDAVRLLWKAARQIASTALKTIGVDWGDPPDDWLFHQRWKKSGICPRHGTTLTFATVGGRTTAWCSSCQPPQAVAITALSAVGGSGCSVASRKPASASIRRYSAKV